MRFPFSVCVVLAALALAFQPTSDNPGHAGAPTPIVFDDFNDNSVNTALWWQGSVDYGVLTPVGSGVTLSEANQRLEADFAGDAAGSLFFNGIVCVCVLSGDFDVQVDYELLVWPSGNGVRVGLHVGTAGAMERTDGLGYLIDFPGSVVIVPTTHTAGKLRITRVGPTLTGYYDDAGTWVAVGSSSGAVADPLALGLVSWSHDAFFGNTATKIAFDNLIVNSGTLVFPTQGDVDCSGTVNAVDALKVLRSNASLEVAQTQPCPAIGSALLHPFGDVDCSSEVNAVDALKILRDNAALEVTQTEQCVNIKLPLYTP